MRRNNKIFYFLSLCLVALFCSCARSGSEQDEAQKGQGYLSLAVERDDLTVNIKNTATTDTKIYTVTISKPDGTQVVKYSDHTAMPERIRLAAGTYNVTATCGDNVNAGFDAPYYKGSAQVTIRTGVTETVTVTCTLANVKATVYFSDKIKQNFSSYDVVLSNQEDGILTFTKDDEGRDGYLKAPEGGVISWTLNFVNAQGEPYTATKNITGVKARDFYTFRFDISEGSDDDEGAFGMNITVDDETDEIEHQYDINLKKKAAPVMVGETFNLEDGVVVNEKIRGVNARVNITSAATLQDLSISHSNDYLSSRGIPKHISFVTSSVTTLQAVATAGITVSSTILDAANTWVDFSTLANTAPLGLYEITISAYDAQRQLTQKTLKIQVLPDQDHMPVSSDPWGMFATINGQWYTLEQPEGITFQYRADGTDAWTTVEASKVTIDANTKKLSVKLHGLTPSTKYYYRTYSDAAGGSETELSFTTEATPTVQNLNFDTWTEGNVWYPNADESNSFWATGNEGTKTAGKGSTTVPVEGAEAKSGKAAKMSSVGGVMVVKHAAGNLYTGTYKTNLSNPRSSAVMGRPYTGRPLGMKGWYRYTPQTITIDKDGKHPSEMGKLDKCHIYVVLEDWGSATTRPDNPVVIARGDFKSDQTVTSYTEFKVMLEYYDTTRRPTHITIAATSSHLGEDFCGSDGATLYVDEFELIFDEQE